MLFFDSSSFEAQAYSKVHSNPHDSKINHELIGGSAAFQAMRSYENHCSKQSRTESHAKAKELLYAAGCSATHRILT